MYANLNNDGEQITTEWDNVVIVDNFASIRGGRTLDTTGYLPKVIYAGHPIIMTTVNNIDVYKPMPVNSLGAITTQGAIQPGSGYTNNGTYTNVSLTGGNGTNARATIVVAGNAVTSVTITNAGTGYKAGDVLSANASNIGTNGSGFSVYVAAVDNTAASYTSLPSSHSYAGILSASILTSKPFAAIMVQGTVNYIASKNATGLDMASILSALKTALPLIDFRHD